MKSVNLREVITSILQVEVLALHYYAILLVKISLLLVPAFGRYTIKITLRNFQHIQFDSVVP